MRCRACCPIAGGGRSWVTVPVCPAVIATATLDGDVAVGWFTSMPRSASNSSSWRYVEKHLYALPQDHGKLVIKILEIRPRGPVHRGRFLVAVPADFTAIPPGDTVEPPGRPHRQRVTFRAG
jgi:hypothetical protein